MTTATEQHVKNNRYWQSLADRERAVAESNRILASVSTGNLQQHYERTARNHERTADAFQRQVKP